MEGRVYIEKGAAALRHAWAGLEGGIPDPARGVVKHDTAPIVMLTASSICGAPANKTRLGGPSYRCLPVLAAARREPPSGLSALSWSTPEPRKASVGRNN